MGMKISNSYSNYANAYGTEQVSKQSNAEKSTETSAADKTYRNAREYKSYLTDKYDCLKSKDYGVRINSSVLSAAMGDEKTSKWLEENLALIPKAMENLKTSVEARGSKIISCNISIDGYDSMSCDLVTRAEADPGTDKMKKNIEERVKKSREEKKAEEKRRQEQIELKREQRKAEEKEQSGKLTVKANNTKELFYTLTGGDGDASGGGLTEASVGNFLNLKA